MLTNPNLLLSNSKLLESVQSTTPLRQRKNGESPYRNSTHSQQGDDDEDDDDDDEDEDSSDGGSGSGSSSDYNGSSDSEVDHNHDPEDNNVLSKLSPKTKNSTKKTATRNSAHPDSHPETHQEEVVNAASMAVLANKDSFATTRREAERRHSLSSGDTHSLSITHALMHAISFANAL